MTGHQPALPGLEPGEVLGQLTVFDVAPPAPAPRRPKQSKLITCCLCGYSTDKPHLMRPYAGSETAMCCTLDGACKCRQENPQAFRHGRRDQ